ncbi:MFS transporter [Corynebacterium glutamicum]|nr:MFS transporter [Corynebacterium glutamicum]ARV63738.1 MFS transporter [Corynebacterium glutamicum]
MGVERGKVSAKALVVWLTAMCVYIVAIAGRTSFGVAGVHAIDRFDIDASRLAVFTSVQVGVYVLAQIPMGMLVDRFDARKLLLAGALILAAGQLILGFTDSYMIAIFARVLISVGDSSAFLSVMRLLPNWFLMSWTPVLQQLTGAFGFVGQFSPRCRFCTYSTP